MSTDEGKIVAEVECKVSNGGRKVVITIKSLTKESLSLNEIIAGLDKVVTSLDSDNDPSKPPTSMMN